MSLSLAPEKLRLLEQEVENGYIRKQSCPDKPLFIYTYTSKTELEEHWNYETRMARGLVLDDKGRVVVNCIPKFFNIGTRFAVNIPITKNTTITEKNDGYLIQIKKDKEYGLIVTSKGSFTSPMVEKTKELIAGCEDQFVGGLLYVCELCCNFPGDEAILVTRWNGVEKLVCFAIRTEDGQEITDIELPSCLESVRAFFPAEIEHYLQRKDVEGVVLYQNGERVKVKTEHFLQMHRIIADVRKIRVWELLSSGKDLEDLPNLPDEFMKPMRVWREELLREYEIQEIVLEQYCRDTEGMSDKEVALWDHVPPYYKKLLFNKRKGKPYSDIIWKNLREQIKEENK